MLPQIQINSLQDQALPRRGRLIPEPDLRLTMASDQLDPGYRARWKDFIHRVFAQAYGADIHSYYPNLYGIQDAQGSTLAVAGARSAAGLRLFAEQYMQAPVEQCLSEHLHTLVTRDRIVEVGNLAPAGAGQARWLIMTITAFLYHAGYRHVVFTAVPALYNAFRKMGLQPVKLANADQQCLGGDGRDEWGAYYNMRPVVYGGDIGRGFQQMEAALSITQPHLRDLWRQAASMGAKAHRLQGSSPLLSGETAK